MGRLAEPGPGPPFDPKLLAGVAEVAAYLGVTPARVCQLNRRRTRGFPPPIANLASGPVWWKPDVVNWNEARREARPGRPRTAKGKGEAVPRERTEKEQSA